MAWFAPAASDILLQAERQKQIEPDGLAVQIELCQGGDLFQPVEQGRWITIDGTLAYQVIGPNGNSITIPASGDGLDYPGGGLITFGLLWTNEALLNEWRDESLMFYFNSSNHYLSRYRTNKTAPIRLVMR